MKIYTIINESNLRKYLKRKRRRMHWLAYKLQIRPDILAGLISGQRHVSIVMSKKILNVFRYDKKMKEHKSDYIDWYDILFYFKEVE